MQRAATQSSIAKIVNMGVDVADARGNSNQVGHAMDVWFELDLGKDPVTPPGAPPGTIYGLKMEYWEHVNVPRDNQGATGEKAWNDIYGMKPDASTFDTAARGCKMTWKAAVEAAAAGTLKGKVKVGFRDIPGLYERVGRNVERSLDFRIVADDGGSRKEVFATQLLRMNNGRMGYSAYKDSKGTLVESHGFGSENYKKKSRAEKQALEREGNRLRDTALPDIASIEGALPAEAKLALPTFVADILASRAGEYQDRELAAFVKLVATDRQAQGARDFGSTFSKSLLGDVTGGVAAGQFMVPTIAGTKRYERALPSGGLLVGLATSSDVYRVYYTSNATKAISLNFIPQLAGKDWTLPLRSFAEIPSETIQGSVRDIRSAGAMGTMKDIKMTGDSTHLHAFTRQGDNYIVASSKRIGPKIAKDDNVSVFDPDIRDVSGNWLMAKVGKTTGFIRQDKTTGARSRVAWARERKGEFNANMASPMKPIFIKHFRDNGNDHTAYTALLAQYPGLDGDISATYKELFGEAQLLKMQLDRETAGNRSEIDWLEILAILWDGNQREFVKSVADYLKTKPGRGDALESTYNQHIATRDYDIPATLGEVVHAHFMSVFRERGDGYAVYNNLATDFPDFAYRLKPAYRLVHGEKKLKAMMAEREQAELDEAVPEPNSLDNLLGYLEFTTHGPFTLTNFVPSTGAGSAKFDAEYNPSTGFLDITVKAAFRFKDSQEKPVDLRTETPQFGREFGRNTWTEQEKNDWIRDYKVQATAPFNNSNVKINCKRPGWDGISVTPRFRVESVALGNQHFVVDVNKAVLTESVGGKKLQSSGVSGAGQAIVDGATVPAVILQQQDIYDKFRDPRLHTYLHAAETSGNVEPAYLLDRQRLEEVLRRLGRIDIAGTTADVRERIRNLADALVRLEVPSTLASLHPMTVTGKSDRGEERARRVGKVVKDGLVAGGVKNPLEDGTDAADHELAEVAAKAVDPAIKATYVTSWSRLTSAHEFGHQIGLIDEYYGAASGETIKEMIAAGWLPPDFRADHLKLFPPKNPDQKEGQEAMMSFLRRTGKDSPDFAPDPPGTTLPKTTSLMTGGYEVSSIHLISAWEALVNMTAGHLEEKFWKLG